MSVDDARNAYIERFGGFPDFLFMGAADSVIIAAVKKALADDEEIKPSRKDVVY